MLNTGGSTDPADELSPRGRPMLQERLVIQAIVVTLVAAGYFPGFYVTWIGHPGLDQSRVLAHIFSPWTFVLLGVHLTPWLICRWGPISGSWLRAIDLGHCAAVGVVFGQVILTHPAPPIVPLEAVLASSAVLGIRALIIPSTGRRTLAAGALLCGALAITIFSNAEHFTASWMGVRTSGAMFLTWASIGIVLTAVASKVLYGLRRQVQDAERLGQYTLVEQLGEGGMGVVYRARHALLRRPTAVKLIRSGQRAESAARFEREVQLMAELTHPNTVAVFDYGRTDAGVFYYAMEYLEGIDLEDLVNAGGAQEPRRVIHILRQVCGSLAEAHQRGLVHRDVKPANLFLCKNRSEPDMVKVLDFGLVKEVETNEPPLSATNTVLGTPLYMAPEAIVGAEKVDARSDLYSLGAVAYMLLTGTPVFQGSTALEVCGMHLHGEPEAPSKRLGHALPADLEAVVLSCLAKSPAERPKSALALREALDACADAGAWTASDAASWWAAHDERIGARRSGVHVSGTAATITIGKDRAGDRTQDLRARRA